MIKVIRYQPDQKDAILALRHDPETKHGLWEWEFEESSRIMGTTFDPVVMADGEKIVGFNGVLPIEVKYGDSKLDALWSCDFYVDSEYRGVGLGKKIKAELIERAPVIMSLGVSPMAARVLSSMGWRLSKVPSFRSSRGIGHVRGLKKIRGLAVWLLQFVYRGAYTFVPRAQATVSWSSRLPPRQEVDGLLDMAYPTYQKTVIRTYQYLEWKYGRHPMATYRFAIARDSEGRLLALLVVREAGGVLRIVDYLGRSGEEGVKRALIRACFLEYPDANQFSITTSDEAFARALKAEGYCPLRSHIDLYVRSSLGDPEPESGWFIMGGDSDGELLSAARDVVNAGRRMHQQEVER